jgi:hypothetical protein
MALLVTPRQKAETLLRKARSRQFASPSREHAKAVLRALEALQALNRKEVK